MKICEVCGESKGKMYGERNKFGKVLCSRHYAQMEKNGRITSVERHNKIELKDDHAILYVIHKNGSLSESIIDLEDVEFASKYKWCIESNGYLFSGTMNKTFHSMIVETPKGMVVDHINQNKLDNRKSNLRVVDKSVNSINSKPNKNNKTGIKGVFFHNKRQKYMAYLTLNGERIQFGYYDNIHDATVARLNGEVKYFGENSPQKHLFEQYGIEVD